MGAQISLDHMQNLNFLEGLRVEVAIDIVQYFIVQYFNLSNISSKILASRIFEKIRLPTFLCSFDLRTLKESLVPEDSLLDYIEILQVLTYLMSS